MCDAVTLFNPVVTTFHVSVLPSSESVKVPVPVAGVVTGFGRSPAPFKVAVKVCDAGPVPLLSQPSPKTSAVTDAAIKPVFFMSPPVSSSELLYVDGSLHEWMLVAVVLERV